MGGVVVSRNTLPRDAKDLGGGWYSSPTGGTFQHTGSSSVPSASNTGVTGGSDAPAGYYKTPTGQYARIPSGGVPPTSSTSSYTGSNIASRGGSRTPTADYAGQQQLLQLQHDLAMQRSSAGMDSIRALMQQYGTSDTSARVSHPGMGGDEQAARDAAFARAKEQAGQTARASMTALQDAVDSRGLMGSSVEAAQTGAIIGGAAGDIGEFLRDRAITESGRAADVSDMNFQAQVTQRGQELGQRQQQMQALLSLIGGLY